MNMNGTKRIRFLTASDRINYGDFLFPLIFKKVMNDVDSDIVFENYGIVKSDFSHFGALPTKSFRTLENEIVSGDKVVIGGGEVLFVNWRALYAFINPNFSRLMKIKRLKRLEKRFRFSNKLLSRNLAPIPFSFDASDFNLEQLNIYYNSVGGGHLLMQNNSMQNLAYKRLSSAKLISLRDTRSLNNFSRFPDLKAKLVPDSAILMSEVFPVEKLEGLIERNLRFRSYIFLQLAFNRGPEDLENFANQIDILAKKLKCKVVMCPIGLAPGHEDDKILKAIKKIKPQFEFIMPKNIFEIMYLIANANLYLGTSLHGAITAMSFLVPGIGLNKRIQKLESYMKTWVNDKFENLEFDSVDFNKVDRLMNLYNTSFTRERLREQQLMVRLNIESIISD